MKKNRDDSLNSVIVLIMGVMLGNVCFVVAEHYTQWMVLLVFFLDLLVMLGFYYISKRAYEQKMKTLLDNTVENVRRVIAAEPIQAEGPSEFPEEMDALYSSIEELRQSVQAQMETRDNVLHIINSIALNIELDELLDDMLPKIIEGTRSNWGAFYFHNTATEKMELKSAFGFSKNIYNEFDLPIGEGFIGRSALTDDITIYNEIPDDTVYVSRTFLGKVKPKAVMTVPISSQGENVASLLLASIYDYSDAQLEIVKMIRYYMGSAVTNAVTYERTKRLKNELLFQNQLIQNMNEELEEKVEDRTKVLRRILNSIVDYAIISMDEDGVIIIWNKGAEALRGFSEEEVMGKHIADTYALEERDEPMKRLEIARKEGKYEEYGWIARKDGTTIFGHISISSIYNERGDLVGFTNITRDMTNLKGLEERTAYHAFIAEYLLDSISNGIVILNELGRVIDLSREAATLLHMEREQLNDMMFEELFEDKTEFQENFEMCIHQQEKSMWIDTIVLSGQPVEVNFSMTGVQIDDALEKVAIISIGHWSKKA